MEHQTHCDIAQKMHSTTSSSIANKSAQWFSMFGPPLEIVTDNGPQYVGQPYEDMCSKWNIKHTTTSPRYIQSNGLIERRVRTLKAIIQKCMKTGNGTLIALQQYQHPQCRRIILEYEGALYEVEDVHHWTATCLVQEKSSSTDLFALHYRVITRRWCSRTSNWQSSNYCSAETAWYVTMTDVPVNRDTHMWSRSEIVTKCAEPCSYIVQTPNGTRLRRTESAAGWEHPQRSYRPHTSTSDIPRRQHGRTTGGAAYHDDWRTTSRWSDVAGAGNQTIRSDDSKAVPFPRITDCCVRSIDGLIVLVASSPFRGMQRTSYRVIPWY